MKWLPKGAYTKVPRPYWHACKPTASVNRSCLSFSSRRDATDTTAIALSSAVLAKAKLRGTRPGLDFYSLLEGRGSPPMKKRQFRFPARFWTEERNLTWLLAALILDTFILSPLVSVLTNEICSRDHEQFGVCGHTRIWPFHINSTQSHPDCSYGDYCISHLGSIRTSSLRRKLAAGVGDRLVNDVPGCIPSHPLDQCIPRPSGDKTPHSRGCCRISANRNNFRFRLFLNRLSDPWSLSFSGYGTKEYRHPIDGRLVLF